MNPGSPEWKAALEVLQTWADDPALLDADPRARTLIAKIHREGARGHKSRARQERQQHDRLLREGTALVRSQTPGSTPQLQAPAPEAKDPESKAAEPLHRPLRCYVCKGFFEHLHPFYHLLCSRCAEFNWKRRHQRADLTGRMALVTGGRIKIGFELALKLLRDGAHVAVSTRFPADALHRFQAQPDFSAWSPCLSLHALDLRFVADVEEFAAQLSCELPHLDILVNNAAQTIARPAAFYAHLLQAEPSSSRALGAAEASEEGALERWSRQYFPPGELDRDGQQVDLRARNSWALRLGEVDWREAGEAYLVNALAPFILCGRLRELMQRSPFERRFMICASAMEGQFGRTSKTAFHPHLNMAKAALNMLVRTSATDLREHGIFLNAVDTGWITDENPHPKASRLRQDGFVPPLDATDGAARLYDPIARGLSQDEEPLWGHFLKDYAPHPW